MITSNYSQQFTAMDLSLGLHFFVKKHSQVAIYCQRRFQTDNDLSVVDPTVLKQTSDLQNFDPRSK